MAGPYSHHADAPANSDPVSSPRLLGSARNVQGSELCSRGCPMIPTKSRFASRRWSALGALCLCAALVVLVNACSSLTGTALQFPEVAGATFVGNRACFECHTNYVRTFAASPHGRIHFGDANANGQAGCESCHGPGSRHIAAGGGLGKFIVNPGRDPDACFQCHVDMHARFTLPHHHPVIEGRMNCVQCHDPHGMDIMKPAGGLAMAQVNESCAECHREQTRPFVFEHEAMREGCTVCHDPHGSVNRKLLVQSDPNLCMRCHAQVQGPGIPPGQIFIGKVPHAALLQSGTCWSAGCHSEVHGSSVHPKLLF